MNRRTFLAGSLGIGVAAPLAQMPLPPRSRTKSPYHTETYEYRGYEISFSMLEAGTEIRYLAVRLMPVSAELLYPQNVLAMLLDAGLVEPNADDFRPVEFTSTGAIFWILTLGQRQKLRIKGGYVYRLGSWFARPPGESADSMQISSPSILLITFGREVPTGQVV